MSYYYKYKEARDSDPSDPDTYMMVNKFGSNNAVGTTEETVWMGQGLYPFPAAAETVRVAAGGNAADDAAGTGARTIIVEGLDANYNFITDTLTTAGITASSYSTASFLRVNRAYVDTVGSGGENAANISIENESADVVAFIPAEHSQTQQCIYTVPAGYSCAIIGMSIHASYTKPSNVELYFRYPGKAWRLVYEAIEVSGASNIKFNDAPIIVPATCDIRLNAKALSTTTGVSGTLELVLMDGD